MSNFLESIPKMDEVINITAKFNAAAAGINSPEEEDQDEVNLNISFLIL